MGNKDADLKIGADTSEANAEFERMASEAMTAGQRVQSAFREAGVRMAESMIAATDKVNAEFKKIINVVTELQGVMLAVGAVLGGGKAFGKMIDESVEVTKEAIKMGKAMGMTATAASVLNVALDDAHVPTETFLNASDKLTKTLRTNEQAILDLGVKTRDSHGNFREMKDIMLDVNERLLSFQEGIDRNIEGQKVYSKSWQEVQGVLKLTKEGMVEASEKAQALGLVVGQENVEATKRYRDAMQDVQDVFAGVKKAVGDALLPVLSDLGEWFSEIGPAAVTTVKGAIGGLVSIWYGLKFAVEVAWNAIAYVIETMTVKILRFADTATHALKLDFEGAKAAWERGSEQLEEIAQKRLKNIMDDAQATRTALMNLFDRPTATTAKTGGEHSAGGKEAKEGKEESYMAQFEAQLAEKRVIYEKEHNLKELSKQDEIAFWQSALQYVKAGSADYIAIRKKIAELELADMKHNAQIARGLEQEKVESKMKAAQDALAMDEQNAQQQLALGQITEKQFIAMQQEFEQRRFDIQVQGQKERIEALRGDPNHDPVALQKVLDQMEDIERQHQLKVSKIQGDAAKAELKSIEQFLQPISSAFDTTIKGMILRTTTWRQAVGNIWKSVLGEFVNMGVKMGTQWLATEILKTKATAAGVAARTSIEEAGATQSGAIAAGSAIKQIMTDAWEAMSGAFKAIVGIPVVGPELAPAAGAAAFATVSGFAANISARGGYDIPSWVNPVVQTHAREMILPEKYADVIRGMAGGGNGAGSGDVHLHLSALDQRGVKRFLLDNKHHVADALKAAFRDGKR